MKSFNFLIYFLFFFFLSILKCEESNMQSVSHLQHLKLPNIILFSIYMGKIKYNYFRLTLASMKFNPQVTFVLINVVTDDATYWNHFSQVVQEMKMTNFIYKVITLTEWRLLVKNKLGIDVPFTTEWYYKLCDYKPTLGYLFEDLIDPPSKKYKYWGYCDMDIIWGNITKFAHVFQENYYFIRTSAHITVGMAQFFLLDNFTLHLYELDPKYVPLLKSIHYNNLDELGVLTDHAIDGGHHSINAIVNRLHDKDPVKYNYPHSNHFYDHMFLEMYQTYGVNPIPLVVWHEGNLNVIQSRLAHQAGRDVLYVHRVPSLPSSLPRSIKFEVIEDMIKYGYILPNWIPLLTRHICTLPYLSSDRDGSGMLFSYHPYNISCFSKGYFDPEH